MAPAARDEINGNGTENGKPQPHVMLLSSLGHGHLIPFMQLAKNLAAKGLTVSFVTTFHHIPSLRKKVEEARKADLDIHLVEVEVPEDHLTLGKVNSNSVQWHQLPPLLAAGEGLQPHFERFLRRFLAGETTTLPPPACLIADVLLGWSSGVAEKFGIPRVNFETSGMFSESVQQIVWDVLPRNLPRTPSGRFVVPGVPREVKLTRLQLLPELPEATPENGTHQFWLRQRAGNKKSWRTVVNSFSELDGEFADHFERVNGTLRTIGPLLPPEVFDDGRSIKRNIAPAVEMGVNTEGEKCRKWLDAQADDSVLYVSFGSENSVKSVQIEELAVGLEASGVKFLWVLRNPSDSGKIKGLNGFSGSALDFLPAGLFDRVVEKNQGMFVLGWAPQLSILAHPATGGFLSHCGWNAVMESTAMGVPMIAWPLYAEQPFNSKFVVDEIKIAMEAPQRIDENWLVTRDDVERVVKMLMVEEKGKELRSRVKDLRAAAQAAVAPGGSSFTNFDLFISEIKSLQQV